MELSNDLSVEPSSPHVYTASVLTGPLLPGLGGDSRHPPVSADPSDGIEAPHWSSRMSVPLSASRWKTLEPLIDAAVELAPERRRAFVRDSCGGDQTLEAELEHLLAQYERHDSQFDQPAVERFSSLLDDDAALPNVLLDRYRIEREVGRGGMATVYLARDLRHERDVAVKVLHPDLAAALGVERFLSEIKTTAKLQHPHILALHDSGEADGFLFYVMPFVEGESLRSRLEREQQLPIDEVVRIASEVASALDAAHKAGVIHRDIKPENILLHNGTALVADFGIALAVSEATPRLTHSGLVLGTPQYMSPEQASAGGTIDARADVYALATVVFEMLAGEVPFTGATPAMVVAKRAAMTAPPVRVLRAAVTPRMDAVVARALAREAVDRYRTAGEFAEALRGALVPTSDQIGERTPAQATATRVPPWLQRAVLVALAGALTAIAAMWVAARTDVDAVHPNRFTAMLRRAGIVDRPMDTSTYVVMADERNPGAAASRDIPDITELVRNGLRRWRDLTVADAPSIADAAGRIATTEPLAEKARDVAKSLGAGRYVLTTAHPAADSLDLSATLFDTRSDVRIVRAQIRVASTPSGAGAAIPSLVDSLVLRSAIPRVARPEGRGHTASLLARRAFLHGQVALEAGDFALADSDFYDAARQDPDYGQALVWLANVRSWYNTRDRPWAQLTQQAAQAVAQRGQLAPGDSILLGALRDLAAGRADLACSAWSHLTESTSYDFAAWYGLGNCLRRDSAVVRDANSPSHWRFRSSYEGAVRAYEHAFNLRPSILRGFGGRALTDLQWLLFTGSGRQRSGRAVAPDSQQFRGIPVWQRDSLAFDLLSLQQGTLAPLPNAAAEAIQHERERFRAVAHMWRVEFPLSADAAEAVAVALEILGNPAALDTLRLARSLATSSEDRDRMAANEVFLRVKFSSPSDLDGLRRARALADSLLDAHRPADNRRRRHSIAWRR